MSKKEIYEKNHIQIKIWFVDGVERFIKCDVNNRMHKFSFEDLNIVNIFPLDFNLIKDSIKKCLNSQRI